VKGEIEEEKEKGESWSMEWIWVGSGALGWRLWWGLRVTLVFWGQKRGWGGNWVTYEAKKRWLEVDRT
jgi:hypothetical protein